MTKKTTCKKCFYRPMCKTYEDFNRFIDKNNNDNGGVIMKFDLSFDDGYVWLASVCTDYVICTNCDQ